MSSRVPLGMEEVWSRVMGRVMGLSGVCGVARIGASAGAGWKHEAQMLAKCADHANIVTLHEVIEDAHYVYIVMEECEGGQMCPLSSLQFVQVLPLSILFQVPRKLLGSC